MRNILPTFALIITSAFAHAQSFEGTIHWNFTVDFLDPKEKAQWEGMAAKLGRNGMLMTGITLKQKGQHSLSSMEGGMFDGNDVLYFADKGERYTIQHKMKTYKQTPPTEKPQPTSSKITKTTETATIAGYNCTKYVIETTDEKGNPLTTNYWTTTELPGVDMNFLYSMADERMSFIYPEIEGIPMKLEISTPKTHVFVEVTELKKATVAEAVFQLPAGYVKK